MAAIVVTLQETWVYCSAATGRRKISYEGWIPDPRNGSETEHRQRMVGPQRCAKPVD